MQEKVLVLDIDGTLTNSKRDHGSYQTGNLEYFTAWSQGDPGFGSSHPGMRKCEEELELKNTADTYCHLTEPVSWSVRQEKWSIREHCPCPLCPGLYEFAKANGCGLITYQGPGVISAFEPDDYVQLEARINGIPIKVVDNFVEYVNFDINKCLMTAPEEIAPELEKQLQEKYSDVASIYRSEPYFIEIMPKDVNKATSLDHMLEGMGLTRENAICCGDGYNDISMIEYAGTGVAMGNAQLAVKDAADYITGTNDEDGLVEVIDKFIMNPEQA